MPLPASPRATLPAKFLAIAADELDHAAHTIGQRILRLYLQDLAETDLLRLTADPTAIRKIFDRILAEDSAASSISAEGLRLKAVRYYPTTKTRDALTYLMDKVTNQKNLSGISLAEACSLLKRDLNHTIRPDSLRAMIKRNTDYHRLVIRRERLRLQSDMVVQMLAAKHQAQRTASVKTVIKRTNKPPRRPPAQPAKTPPAKSATRAKM